MEMIDPTYLRMIHAGLLSGSVHKDNASALPQGLVGMYEEALPPARNVSDRKKFLEFFAVWSLLKREVSVGFLSAILNEKNNVRVLDDLLVYSRFFNSPVAGRFILYHENFRAFILGEIGNIERRNLLLIEQLLSLELAENIVNEEVSTYLQEFYGDHMAAASFFSQDSYEKLKGVDLLVANRIWKVKGIDRIRWNSHFALIASKYRDLEFLKQIAINQDAVVNVKLDIDSVLLKINQGDWFDFEDLWEYRFSDEEKRLFLFALIAGCIDFFDSGEIHSVKVIPNLNRLIDLLNSLGKTSYWIVTYRYIEEMNSRLGDLSGLLGAPINPIVISNYDSQEFRDAIPLNVFRGDRVILQDLEVTHSHLISLCSLSLNELEISIKGSLMRFLENEVSSYFEGDSSFFDNVKLSVRNYSLETENGGNILVDILKNIKCLLSETRYDFLNYNYDDDLFQVLRYIHFSPLTWKYMDWMDCFCDPVPNLYRIECLRIQSKLFIDGVFEEEEFYKFDWHDNGVLNSVVASIDQIYRFKGLDNLASDFYKKAVSRILNFGQGNNRLKYVFDYQEGNPDSDYLIDLYEKREFAHVPSLSFYLCQKMELLDIISILRDDQTHFSSVDVNEILISDILYGVVCRLGFFETGEYILWSLEEYVSVMGEYESEDYEMEANRPAGNTWKLEWWVLGQVVNCFLDLINQARDNKTSKSLFSDSNLSGNFISVEDFLLDVDLIFLKANSDPEINLYRAMLKHPTGSNYKRLELYDVYFDYKLNTLNTLFRLNSNGSNPLFTRYLASAILSES
jgi:hypothetical protein